jgi:PAS domain S-box-containing protein
MERRVPSRRNTRRPRQRKSVALSERILSLLARSADGVFAVDTNQRVVFWSGMAEELLGRRRSEVLGKYCYEILMGKDYEGHPFCRRDCPTIRAARRGRGVPNYDIACPRNGGELWVNVSVVPVPRRMMGDATAIHIVRDVSQRRRSERLAQATIDTVTRFMPENSDAEAAAEPYPAPHPSLTAREIEVLRLLVGGFGTQALAHKLGLSDATVRNHIQRLLAKLGVHSRLEAVVYGARHRLI